MPDIYAAIAFETVQQLGLIVLHILELIHFTMVTLWRSRTGEGGFYPPYHYWREKNILGATALAACLTDKQIFIVSNLPLYLEVELHCISFLKNCPE